MSIRVTVVDEQTGETKTQRVPENDYMLLATGTCHVTSVQTYPKSGTHVVTIKGRTAPGPVSARVG